MSSVPPPPPPPAFDDAVRPLSRQQHGYSFSGRVLLTAVLILAILTVVFVLIRLLLVQFVLRGGRLGGGGVVRRSFGRLGGSSRRGLDAAALAALPVTAYSRKHPQAEGAGGSSTATDDCAVCLSELADGEKVRALPGCGHVFHVECVDAWLRTRTTCPVCRAEVAPPKRDAGPVLGAGGGNNTVLVVTVQGGGAAAQTTRLVLGSSARQQPATGAAGQVGP